MQIGDYEVLGEIARGGAGVVYRARHRIHGTPVAIKVLQLQSTPDFVERFRREAHVTFRLRHPHVVGLLEWGQHQGHPFLVLELIEGQSLAARLREKGPLPPRQIFQIGREVADALHYAHGMGLVHRDIKPANILVEVPSNRAVLTDFGIAQVAGGTAERLTITGEVLGTPAFMSPEQARGAGEVGHSSDVYSLGATLYALLCGRPPVTETAPVAAMAAVITDPPDHPLDIYPAANPDLAEIVMRCLAKEPRDRFKNAAALRDALADASRVGTPGATGANRPTPRQSSRWPSVTGAAGVALVAGALLGYALKPGGSAPTQPTSQTSTDDPPSRANQPTWEVGSGWLTPHQETVRLSERAEQAIPQRWEPYAELADHYDRLEEFRRAADALAKAEQLTETGSNERARLSFLRGRLQVRLGEVESALAAADALLERDSDDVRGWNLRAMALEANGEASAALEAARRARQLSGDGDFETRILLANLLRLTGDTEAALAEVRALEQAGVHYTRLLLIKAKLVDDKAALSLYERALHLHPNDPSLLRQFALVAYSRSEWELAAGYAHRARSIAADDLLASFLLVDSLVALKRWPETIEVCAPLVSQAPESAIPWFTAQLAHALSKQNPNRYHQQIEDLTTRYRTSNSSARYLMHAQANLHFGVDSLRVFQLLEPLWRQPGDPNHVVQPDNQHLISRAHAGAVLRDCQRAQIDITDEATSRNGPVKLDKQAHVFLRQGLPFMAYRALGLHEGQVNQPGSQRLERATALLMLGKAQRAVEEFRRCGDQLERRGIAYARALRLAGEEQAAKQQLHRALGNRLPNLPEASALELEQAALAWLKANLREQVEAERRLGFRQARKRSDTTGTLDELLLLEPNDPQLRLMLISLLNLANYGEAPARSAAQYLAGEPGMPARLLGDVASLTEVRRPGIAALFFLEAVRRDPEFELARERAAELHLGFNLFETAERLADEGLKRTPNDRLLAMRGIARAALGHAGAEADLRQAQTAKLSNLAPRVSVWLGRVLTGRGANPDEILPLLEPALRSPDISYRAAAHVLAANAHLIRGDPTNAHHLLQAVYEQVSQGAHLLPGERELLTKLQLQVIGLDR